MSNKKNSINATIAHRELTQWQGPLPPPESLEKYNRIVPGSAQTIIDMAVKEQQHRHESEDKGDKRQYVVSLISMVLAFICVLALVGLVFYAIHKGSNNAYLAAIISAIATVAGVFVLRKLIHFKKQ